MLTQPCSVAVWRAERQAQLDAREAVLSGLEAEKAAAQDAAAAAAKAQADARAHEALLVSQDGAIAISCK